MFAENAKTMNLLAEKARELGAIIQQHTGNQTNVEVVDQKTMENQNQNKEQKGDGFARQHKNNKDNIKKDYVKNSQEILFSKCAWDYGI